MFTCGSLFVRVGRVVNVLFASSSSRFFSPMNCRLLGSIFATSVIAPHSLSDAARATLRFDKPAITAGRNRSSNRCLTLSVARVLVSSGASSDMLSPPFRYAIVMLTRIHSLWPWGVCVCAATAFSRRNAWCEATLWEVSALIPAPGNLPIHRKC